MAVFKRGGKWRIGYPLGNGKYRREVVGTNHALAKEALAKRLNELSEGRLFPGRSANARLFSEVADQYWELHARHLRSKTWGPMVKTLRQVFGPRKMGEIGAVDIQRYYNEVATRASNATANRHLGLVRAIFNKAKAWNLFYGENPCATIKKQREPAHRLRYLNRDEMDRLLATAHPRLYPVLVCALMTGMRRGEILGLDWANVSLDQGTIYVLESKSGKPREIPIVTRLRDLLLGMGPKREGPVFALPKIMLRRYFERVTKAAEIHSFRFHDLRHTFASHFIMKTNDLPALQKLLGHSTTLMTLRYAHLSKGHLVSEMAAFESAMPVLAERVPDQATVARILHQQPSSPYGPVQKSILPIA